MLRKILLVITGGIVTLFVMLAIVLFLGGIPVGYQNNHVVVYSSYNCCDIPPYNRTVNMYSRVSNREDCKKLGGDVLSGVWIDYAGCGVK